MPTQQRSKPETRKKKRISETLYRGPKHEWTGFTPVGNWRRNPSLAPRVYDPIAQLTRFPYSSTALRDVDLGLLISHNARLAGVRAKLERRRKRRQQSDFPADFDFLPFSPTAVGHGTGYSRKVCRLAFDALVTAGLFETRESSASLYRPRSIDHEAAEAFATFVKLHGVLPSADWWRTGTNYPQSVTVVTPAVTAGTTDPPSGDLLPAGTEVSTRPNSETPRPDSLNASEEVEKKYEKNTDDESSPSKAKTRLSKEWTSSTPNETKDICKLCAKPLDLEAIVSEDPAIQGYCIDCRSM